MARRGAFPSAMFLVRHLLGDRHTIARGFCSHCVDAEHHRVSFINKQLLHVGRVSAAGDVALVQAYVNVGGCVMPVCIDDGWVPHETDRMVVAGPCSSCCEPMVAADVLPPARPGKKKPALEAEPSDAQRAASAKKKAAGKVASAARRVSEQAAARADTARADLRRAEAAVEEAGQRAERYRELAQVAVQKAHARRHDHLASADDHDAAAAEAEAQELTLQGLRDAAAAVLKEADDKVDRYEEIVKKTAGKNAIRTHTASLANNHRIAEKKAAALRAAEKELAAAKACAARHRQAAQKAREAAALAQEEAQQGPEKMRQSLLQAQQTAVVHRDTCLATAGRLGQAAREAADAYEQAQAAHEAAKDESLALA